MKRLMYGCETIDLTEGRNKELIMATELLRGMVGNQQWQEINDEDKAMYEKLNTYADNLRAR